VSTVTSPTTADRSRTTEPRRGLSLARAEALLLVRNRTALFTALLIPLMLTAIVAVSPESPTKAPQLLGMIVGTSLLFVVYYTLVTSTVARREKHTFKRLYTSSARPATVLFAMAVPAIVLMLMQVIVGGVAVTLLVGLDNRVHIWLLVPTMAAAAAV
jgi:ABC-2 type transport system permease protein